MLQKILLHKKNGHRKSHGEELSPGEVIRLVHSDGQSHGRSTADLLRFVQIVASEKASDGDASALAQALATTREAFDRGELADVRAALERLHVQADMATEMIGQLVSSVQRRIAEGRHDGLRRVVDVTDVLRDAIAVLGAETWAVPVSHHAPLEPLRIVGNAAELQEALGSLITYAMQVLTATGNTGAIAIESSTVEAVLQGERVVRLRIHGERAPERLPAGHRPEREVNQVDLYLASKVVTDHGGSIAAESLPCGGAAFVLEFSAL
jgi:C4-dicarboxylate-specific signal transduction histidine kinase